MRGRPWGWSLPALPSPPGLCAAPFRIANGDFPLSERRVTGEELPSPEPGPGCFGLCFVFLFFFFVA